MEGLGDFGDVLGDLGDDELPSLDWDEGGSDGMPDLDDGGGDLMVSEWGSMPWGPGASEAYQPWAQSATDSPPMGDEDIEEPAIAALNAHPDVDPDTIYDRDSFEGPLQHRKTYGQGIFDLPDQGAVFNENDGIFANNYALPDYLAREPEMDVFETEGLDVNTGLPTVAQVNATGVQLMRSSDPERAWSPFAPPAWGTSSPQNVQPYSQAPLYSQSVSEFGRRGARELLELAAYCYPTDPNQRGYFICQMIDAMIPNLSPRALAAVAKLNQAGYRGNAVELVVGHVLMHVVVCDLGEKAQKGDASMRMPRLDRLRTAAGARTPKLAEAARQLIAPLATRPDLAAETAQAFKQSQDGQTTRGMLGDEAPAAESGPAPASAAANGESTPMTLLKYLLGAAAVAGVGWVGWDMWQRSQKKKPTS